jgi:hypothetical protein
MIDYANGEGSPGDLRARLTAGDQISEEDLIELLCSDQARRWRAAAHIPAETYLSLHPGSPAQAKRPSSWFMANTWCGGVAG